jgi:NADH dehydrogenase [ubiquinone] 1 alpha subcomplex assembly factor 5
LSPLSARRTSAAVNRDLFDRHLRALRRDRAARSGPDLFLFERAFEDCLDRLRDIPRSFERALLLGCPSPDWPERLKTFADEVEVCDPGSLFAAQAGGHQVEEDRHDFGEQRFDLCVAIGTLDTVNDLLLAFQLLCRSLRSDSPLIGAITGGNSLPALRASLIEAGRAEGLVVARTHPRIEPASLAQLLGAAGFAMPVVDVDRVRLRYKDLGDLVSDLRAMAGTAVLGERPPPLSRHGAKLASTAFSAQAKDGRTEEILEILHFIAWTK